MRKIYKKLISLVIFLIVTFGIMIPLYVHYTARQFTGAYDTLLLSKHSPYDTILIEVHYQEGAEPYAASLSTLKEKVANYTGKNVIVVKYPDLKDFEISGAVGDDGVKVFGDRILQNHTLYHSGWLSGRMVIYLIYTNSNWEGNTNFSAAGITYNADSIIVFKDVVKTEEIETPVLLHEMGHLWGLEHSNKTDDIMNVHIDEYLLSHVFNKLPDDFSDEERKMLLENHDSWLIFPMKPYETLYSAALNRQSTMG
jgi:hypothetical protein